MWKRLSRLVHRARFERELDEELRDHMAKYSDDLVASGMSRDEAERRARKEFGAVAGVKEDVREAGGLSWVEGVMRHTRFACRVLRKNPIFALTVIVTLALAIGANTAVFSVVNAMFLRPLPYPNPERLGSIYTHVRGVEGVEYDETAVRGVRWEFVHERVTTLDVGLHRGLEGVNLVDGSGQAEFLRQLRVTSGFFRVLGVAPFLGREFLPEEDVAGGPAVVIISHALWKRAFSSNPAAIGKSILLRGEPYTVTGVMPEHFATAPAADLWTPLRPSRTGEGSGLNYAMIARVRPGFSVEQASAELGVLGEAFLKEVGRNVRPGYSSPMRFVPLQGALAGPYETEVFLVWAATGLVLLIGCINIAGLMVGRATSRRHEMATRLALGSGRRGIVAQLLSESMLLAVTGGILGIVIGYAAIRLLQPVLVETLQPAQSVTIDVTVLAVSGVLTLTTALLFGLYPALSASRTNIHAAMGTVSRSATRRPMRVRHVLLVGEVALGMVLLISAGLVLRTLSYLNSLDPGFDPRNVMAAAISLRDARYATRERVLQLYDASLERIRTSNGVIAAGVGLSLPYDTALNMQVKVLAGPQGPERTDITNITYGTPGYFEALRFKLIQGRWFGDADTANAPSVVLVNEAFARELYRGVNVVGGRLFINGKEREIVGVVGDVQQHSNWGNFGPIGPARSIYLPATQTEQIAGLHGFLTPQWVVRTTGAAVALPELIRGAVAAVDPRLPIAEFRTMDDVQSGRFSIQRLESAFLTTLAGLALLLAAIGIFGLIAHNVVQRTREFGIRLALGCPRWNAVIKAGMPGVLLTAIGLAIGSFLALQTGKLVEALLIGVKANDVSTFLVVSATLLAAAAVASFLPSLRIIRIDPARTLRDE